MDFAHTADDIAFRDELRLWLDDNLPKFLADWGEHDPNAGVDADPDGSPGAHGITGAMERRRAWQRKLNEGQWAAINWPVEWGGRARPSRRTSSTRGDGQGPHAGIYNANGLWQIGPMIIQWGTDEQKAQWIPNILNADDHWCQGFSEPEAGSDLANLRTLAVRDGDDYVLNGQKIWISTAHIAKWGLFLVRTDPTAIERGVKHEGITALIIDMEADGIECRPIRDITGEDMFNEVFFTDARVPVKYRLGDEGAGWQVAMGTLGRERVGTAGLAITMKADLESMVSLARAVNPDALRDPELRERIARHTRTSSTRGCSTTARCRRSSRASRTGPRCRSRSCSGATSHRRWPISRAISWARQRSSERAAPMPSMAARGTGCTCSSGTRRSARARPKSRRTSSARRRSSCLEGERLCCMTAPTVRPASRPLRFRRSDQRKLYLQGAGWSRIVANQPIALAVALFWRIPWGKANPKQEVTIR